MQLTLNFDAGLAESFPTCRELIADRVHHQRYEDGRRRYQKAIAADMDYSPSDLSRKLSQSPDDSRRFTLDDFEKFIQVTGDTTPVLYLVEKYLSRESVEEIERKILALQKQLDQRGAA
jgi:uncharacterized protein YlzI (FlbEa/FlbD family)